MSVTPLHPPTEPVTARFAPIPLVSGDHITSGSGAVPIESVVVTINDATGSATQVVLESRSGGWWAPADALSHTTT